jgi:hypothetical protein
VTTKTLFFCLKPQKFRAKKNKILRQILCLEKLALKKYFLFYIDFFKKIKKIKKLKNIF